MRRDRVERRNPGEAEYWGGLSPYVLARSAAFAGAGWFVGGMGEIMIDRRGPRQMAFVAWAARLLCACAAVCLIVASAFANDEPNANGVTAPSIATSLPYNGDPTGLRKLMATYGATFNFIYTNDVLGNVNGGLRRGVIDQGKLEYNMTVDFAKLIG